eukprot:10325804-Alexandrium_andersonii.AAC.1
MFDPRTSSAESAQLAADMWNAPECCLNTYFAAKASGLLLVAQTFQFSLKVASAGGHVLTTRCLRSQF